MTSSLYKKTALSLFAGCIALTSLGACTTAIHEDAAMRLASPAWMVKREINADPFILTAFERMHERGQAANIYIEGDGGADADLAKKPSAATPLNPVALNLAAFDNAKNLAYIARPCQYSGMLESSEDCDTAYIREKSFAPEVITAYNTALDKMKKRYDLKGFNVVGHGGGGAIAAILAATRDDVISLRTVAGNLDPETRNAINGLPKWTESRSPMEFVSTLRNIPQFHVIGGQDHEVPPAILESYLQAIGDSNCISHTIIQEAEHSRGWGDKWTELLRAGTPTCSKPMMDSAIDFTPIKTPEPIYRPRMIGDKK